MSQVDHMPMHNSQYGKPMFTSAISTGLIQSMGNDEMIVHAAQVSTKGLLSVEGNTPEKIRGMIRFLMRQRHGTPFECNAMTFLVHVPIFVFREWHRHRIGWSYNEESGRYKELDPVFYLPPVNRPMFKVEDWKPGKPKFTKIATDEEKMKWGKLCDNLRESYTLGYEKYKDNLSMGFDPGLTRDCLPVGIYSSMYATCNARSLMHFLSLRTHEPLANHPSYPLFEIEEAARQLETVFKELFPLTYESYLEFGRECP